MQLTHETETTYPLSAELQWLLGIGSFLIVAFGQPSWAPWAGLAAAAVGYALFWRILLACKSWKRRFWIAFAWYGGVQLVQISWFTSHPYAYIYAPYLFIGFMTGVQFGILSLFITPKLFAARSTVQTICRLLSLSGLWAIFEWSRLFALSGYSWNPSGIALTGHLYPLQMASLAGVFGLSFWVIFVNLLALRAWLKRNSAWTPALAWGIAALVPYAYGIAHISQHDRLIAESSDKPSMLRTLLVQTAIPAEEASGITDPRALIRHVMEEWRQILEITKAHRGKEIDLIALPEFVVPFGTYSCVYPYLETLKIIDETLGNEALKQLPPPDYPFAAFQPGKNGPEFYVNNAFWVQTLANLFGADVLAGLEDAEDTPEGVREYYSAAIFSRPHGKQNPAGFEAERYAKRVLVPLGEYIPFSFCRKLAENYGVFGSFTPGQAATVVNCRGIPLSPSICYEETFGHIISEGRRNGGEMLVNLTSDVWYPYSKLPRQHFDHARLRTVENGTPLVRACNTGITGAFDSFGRILAVLGGDEPEKYEWVAGSLLVEVPTYHYPTLYGKYGDWLIVGFSSATLLSSMVFLRRKRHKIIDKK